MIFATLQIYNKAFFVNCKAFANLSLTILRKCATMEDEGVLAADFGLKTLWYISERRCFVIKRESRFLYELANILCWFRIGIGVLLACSPRPHFGLAILCSLAFLTDVMDGWCYRKFVKVPYRHWFNRLPISMDPIADFVFVMGGVLHCSETLKVGLLHCVGLAVIALGCNLFMALGSDRTYTIVATFLTHFWFLAMEIVLARTWFCNSGEYWWVCVIITLSFFSSAFALTRQEESRLIRRRR